MAESCSKVGLSRLGYISVFRGEAIGRTICWSSPAPIFVEYLILAMACAVKA
jgi:hypothetical protein